jgi:hypothetical protein
LVAANRSELVSAVLAGTGGETFMASEERKWTVMVFMGAERVPGDADLVTAAVDDIAEMRALYADGSEGPLNLFVQLHGDGDPQRFNIGTSETFEVDEAEGDVTNGNALLAFMRWALEAAGGRETDHTILVLWGHAYDFAIGRAVSRSGIDALDFAELAAVLERFQKEHKTKLDIVGFDACDLATIEMAYQLHDYADYLLASQIGIPLPGWPYYRILDRIKKPEGRLMGPAELGSYIVRRFCEAYLADKLTVSLTLLDLTHASKLAQLTENLARKLAIALGKTPGDLDVISELFSRSQTVDEKPFVDAADLCLNLFRYCNDPAVREAAEKLGDSLITAEPVIPGESEAGAGRPFIVEHGRNACRTARLHGVSLYAPHVVPTFDFEAAGEFYDKLTFAKETLWNDVVRALAHASF